MLLELRNDAGYALAVFYVTEMTRENVLAAFVDRLGYDIPGDAKFVKFDDCCELRCGITDRILYTLGVN